MKTNLQRINTRFWQNYHIPLWRWLVENLQILTMHKLHTLTENRSYAFLKWLLWVSRYWFSTGGWTYVDLWKQGIFMTPSSPEGDEPKDEPAEVGDTAVWYPFKPVPNVRHFEVKLRAIDPLFAMFGIKKRFSPIIKFEKFGNHKFNRYMEIQLTRLEDARVGKLASEDDFTTVQLVKVSNGKVIDSFSSAERCAEVLFGDATSINYAEVLSRIESMKRFKWKKQKVYIRTNFREKDWLEQTYEVKEKVTLGSITEVTTVRRYKPNSVLYFRIVNSLLKHSRVFFMRQVMLTEPRWHREIPYHQIIKWWMAHRKIARQASSNFNDYSKNDCPKIKYHRTYIPKANGKLRPLGVPSPVWRIYLAQWNKFLLKWVKGKINAHQHAYQPQKGTITLWRDIMENIVDKRNIYSFDLTKYFDSVYLKSSIEALNEKFDVPWPICYYLGEMHKSLPINMKKNLNDDPLKPNAYIKENLIESEIKLGTYEEVMYETSGWMEDWNVGLSNVMEPPSWIGIPQGGSLSPLLAIVLQESEYIPQFKEQGASFVGYADDGLAASNNDKWIPKISVPSQGIIESGEKSFWVKKNGVWLKPLDLCGLRYDGVLNRIIANTRSGSRLELKDVDGLVPLLALRELVPSLVEKGEVPASEVDNPYDNPPPEWAWEYVKRRWSSPREHLKHQVWGFLQSRLFSGSWELEDYEQDFRLTAIKYSLVSLHYKQLRALGVNVFTSTSWAFPVVINDLGESRRNSLQRWRLKSLRKRKKDN